MLLAIESSCDETAIALLNPPRDLRVNLIASQHAVHAPFGGVVPELAARRHMEVILPLLEEALQKAGASLDDITAVAATSQPGLIGALLVGLSFAKAFAFSRNLPFIGVNHLEGHLNAVHLEHDSVPYPHLGVVVSGGHTQFYIVSGFAQYRLVGATRDDAAGEAFDKVAKLLGLGYPGGPLIDKLAPHGNPKAIRFSLPKFNASSKYGIGPFDVSFSGLKTAVALHYKSLCEASPTHSITETQRNDLIASFQHTAVAILMRSIEQIVEEYHLPAVVLSGGVAANSALRAALQQWGQRQGVATYIPSLSLCVDNAAMIAYVGWQHLQRGTRSGWELNAVASGHVDL